MRRIVMGVASAMTIAGTASLVIAQQAPPERDKGPAIQDRGQRQPGPAQQPGTTDVPKRSDQPKSTEQPERGRSKTGQQPDRDIPRGADRPDKERPKATERPDRDRPKATEQPDRDRPKATERPDRERQKATERPDQERPKATERPDRERPKATERPDQERPKATERPDKERQKFAQPEGGKDQQGRLRVTEKERSDAGARLRQTQVQKAKVNIRVNVGSTVPRTVRLRPLPVAIFAVAPAYRSYSYVVLEDDTIVIVDARTYVVVDVIPAETRRVERRTPLVLSTEQMRFIYTRVPRGRTADVRVRLALGAEVPRSVDLLRFPDDVAERVPEIRPYRYIVAADDVAIVDPRDNAVVLVISE
jgi:hypothetical protein